MKYIICKFEPTENNEFKNIYALIAILNPDIESLYNGRTMRYFNGGNSNNIKIVSYCKKYAKSLAYIDEIKAFKVNFFNSEKDSIQYKYMANIVETLDDSSSEESVKLYFNVKYKT